MEHTASPEAFIKKRWSAIGSQPKAAFFTALAAGGLCHLYFFAQRLTNEDDIWCLVKGAADVRSGRWLNNILNDLRFDYTPPFLIFLGGVLFLALAAGLICSLLRLRGTAGAVITGLLVATYPSVAYTAGYVYAFDGYMLALLLATLAVWLADRYKWGFAPGAAVLMLSLAIYQGYVSIAMALCLLTLILHLLADMQGWKAFGLRAGRLLLTGGLGYVFYRLSVSASLAITGNQLTTYKGLDQMGMISLSALPSAIKACYRAVVAGYMGRIYTIPKPILAAMALAVALFAAALVLTVWKEKKYKRPLPLLLGLAGVCLIPVAIYPAPVLMPGQQQQQMLIMYAFVLPWLLVVAYLDRAAAAAPARLPATWLRTAGLACLLAVGVSQFIFSNVYYLKLETFYTRTIMLTDRILARVEELLPQAPGRQVAVIGRLPNEYYGDATLMFTQSERDQGIWGQFIGYNSPYDYEVTSKFIALADSRLGVKLVSADGDAQRRAAAQSPDRPVWPAPGSVYADQGVIVVNLGAGVIDHSIQGEELLCTVSLPLGQAAEHPVRWQLTKDGASLEAFAATGGEAVSFRLAGPGSYRILCFYKTPQSQKEIYVQKYVTIE